MVRRLLLLAMALCAGCGNGTAPPASSAVPVGTQVGEMAPPLDGRLPAGEPFNLDTIRDPTVVIFYNTAACGLCALQLDRVQDHIPAYERLGASVVAVTLDPPERSAALLDTTRIRFPVVSTDTATFERWGIISGDRRDPPPAAFVLDSTGTVRFRDIGRNAADRTTDAELVTVLEGVVSE